MRSPRALLLLLLAAGLVASPALEAQTQTLAPCPQEVNPRLLEYPSGYIPFSEGGRSGNFWIDYLYDPLFFLNGPRSKVEYLTEPDLPRDRDNPRMVWDLAAIDAICFYTYYGLQRVWTVNELWKFGVISLEKDDGCGGGGDAVGEVDYNPYEPEGGSEDGSCGNAGGGDPDEGAMIFIGAGDAGGGACGGLSVLYYDHVCVDVWVEGVGWVEWWCGVAAFCG